MRIIKSAIPGMQWPAVPDGRAARLLAMLWQFGQSERWPAGELLDHQLRQLSLILDHARRHVPFYRERLDKAGWSAGQMLTLDRLRGIPPLTRRDLQDGVSALRSTVVLQQLGDVQESRSSGSTGQPVLVLRSALDGLLWQANTLRDHHWHGRDPSLKLAAIRAVPAGAADPPLGAMATGWGPASEALYATGPAALLSLNAHIDKQAAWLRNQAPGYLLTYPSNLAALLDHFSAAGAKLPGLRAVLTVGETVTPRLRLQCREVLGVDIEDAYSSQELGYIALQCPVSGQYHVMAECVLVEVLDDEGRPCAQGETGRLVVSSLHNQVMPLIRYEIGDYATVGQPCACGRTLPTLERIAGRERNMLRLPGGGRRWPVIGPLPYRDVAPVRRFQMIQHSLEELEVRLVVDRALSAEEESRLARMITDSLGHPFRIRFSRFEKELPRPASGKLEDFVCAIPAD
ncbi:MAG: phenylacetate--CoA ligase family protein [Burkholderiales bacterium]|nr:phenylacetate--CoA ligase family protein [Burkholderiales bacterium]